MSAGYIAIMFPKREEVTTVLRALMPTDEYATYVPGSRAAAALATATAAAAAASADTTADTTAEPTTETTAATDTETVDDSSGAAVVQTEPGTADMAMDTTK